MLNRGVDHSKIRKYISENTGLSKSQVNRRFNKIISGHTPPMLECKESYVFNKADRTYVVFLKNAGKNVVVPERLHKSLMAAYIGDMPVDEIESKFSFPASYLPEYKKIFGWQRRGVPITDEDAMELSVESCAEKMLAEKKFDIIQEFNKESWKQTQQDASKWQDFYYKKFEPFQGALDSWSPAKIPPFKSPLVDKKSDKVFLVGLSDLHFGASANSAYMFNRPSWSTKKTVDCVDKFADSITQDVRNRNEKFKKCVIVSLGDILHSVSGKTGRGTELIYDCIEEEQFDYALESLRVFIQRMVELFGACEVHSVGGNHHYEGDVMLFRALDMFFRSDKRITFSHHSSRPSHFIVDKTLIMMDHGADHKERTYVPPRGLKLEKHVQSLLLSVPDIVSRCKSFLFLVGDKHHWEHIEYSNFEFLMFGTTMGSCQHASVNNWKNRARQSCLILDNNGLKEILHTYFS